MTEQVKHEQKLLKVDKKQEKILVIQLLNFKVI